MMATKQQWQQLTVASRSVRRRPTNCLIAPRLWLKHQRTRDDASEKAQLNTMPPSPLTTDGNIMQLPSSASKFSMQEDIKTEDATGKCIN